MSDEGWKGPTCSAALLDTMTYIMYIWYIYIYTPTSDVDDEKRGAREENKDGRGGRRQLNQEETKGSLALYLPSCSLAHFAFRSWRTFRQKITNDATGGSDGATRLDRKEEKGSNGSGDRKERRDLRRTIARSLYYISTFTSRRVRYVRLS